MSKRVVFLNTDKKALREVLLNVGQKKFHDNMKARDHKPIKSLKDLRLKFHDKRCLLERKDGYHFFSIMQIRDYEMPKFGWVVDLESW